MDISLSLRAPAIVADLRPAADAAATARIDRPPLALAAEVQIAPVSLTQEGLVNQGIIAPEALSPVAPLPERPLASGDAPQRVLKPWGVPMLPFEGRDRTLPGSGADPSSPALATPPAPAPDVALSAPSPRPDRTMEPAEAPWRKAGAASRG